MARLPYHISALHRYVQKMNKEGVLQFKGKHLVSKHYKYPIDSDPALLDYKEFVSEGITDQILSRIQHQEHSYAAKGQFLRWNEYASRLYCLDHTAASFEQVVADGSKVMIHDRDMNNLLYTSSTYLLLPQTNGVTAGIADNIITGNGDNKPPNIAVYPNPLVPHSYDSCPIDLGAALQNQVRGNQLIKRWSKEDFLSIIFGTGTPHSRAKTAQALIDTVGTIGLRSNMVYAENGVDDARISAFRQLIVNELDTVAEGLPEHQRTHSHALLAVFERQCDMMSRQQAEALSKTSANIGKYVLPQVEAHLIAHHVSALYPGFHQFITDELARNAHHLTHAVTTFRGYIAEAHNILQQPPAPLAAIVIVKKSKRKHGEIDAPQLWEHADYHNATVNMAAITDAATQGDLALLQSLMQHHKRYYQERQIAPVFPADTSGHSPLIYARSYPVLKYLIDEGITPTAADCRHPEYTSHIKDVTYTYSYSAPGTDEHNEYWNMEHRLRDMARNVGVTNLQKYFIMAPKETGAFDGTMVMSLSRKIDKPEGERIKYWMLKTNVQSANANHHMPCRDNQFPSMFDIYTHQLAVALRGKKNAPKAKPVEFNRVAAYVSRYLGHPNQLLSCDNYVTRHFPRPDMPITLRDEVKQAIKNAVSFALITGDDQLSWKNIILSTDQAGTPVNAYGINHDQACYANAFGGNSTSSYEMAPADFRSRFASNVPGMARLLADISEEHMLDTIMSDATNIKAQIYPVMEKVKRDFTKINAVMKDQDSQELIDFTTHYNQRALDWVTRARIVQNRAVVNEARR